MLYLAISWKVNKLTTQNDCSETCYKGCFCPKSVESLRKDSLPQNHVSLNRLSYNLGPAKYDNCCTLITVLGCHLKCLTTIYIYIPSMQGNLHGGKGKNHTNYIQTWEWVSWNPISRRCFWASCCLRKQKTQNQQQVSAATHFSFPRQLCSFVQGLAGI